MAVAMGTQEKEQMRAENPCNAEGEEKEESWLARGSGS